MNLLNKKELSLKYSAREWKDLLEFISTLNDQSQSISPHFDLLQALHFAIMIRLQGRMMTKNTLHKAKIKFTFRHEEALVILNLAKVNLSLLPESWQALLMSTILQFQKHYA